MAQLTLLTAVHQTGDTHFQQTVDSVVSARAAGADVLWAVQEDGSRMWAERLGVPWVAYESSGRCLGAATARNIALSHVRTPWVAVLDHDDVLLAGATDLVAAVSEAPADVGWISGRALDLHEDGSAAPFGGSQLPAGRHPAGATTAWLEEHGTYPLHCAGMAVRTELIRSLGGWVATPRSEDVALMAVLTHLTDGLVLDVDVWAYRQWAGQTRRRPEWLTEQQLAAAIVRDRLDAVRRSGLSFAPQDELDGPGGLPTA